MKRGILGITWLNEQLTAAWVDRAGAVQIWRAERPVTQGASLSEAIREARRRSGGSLRRVTFLVDHRSLLFHVQETPPTEGRMAGQVLDRLVEENQFFDEPAIWAKLPLPASAKRHRWLLALMPRAIWMEIRSACDDNDLELVDLYPAPVLLAEFLGRVSAKPDEAVLLVADFGGTHGLLVGRGDGQVLFARSIAGLRGESNERLDQEINRTLHFAQQRLGGQVTRLVALGAGCCAGFSGGVVRDGIQAECLLTDIDQSGFAGCFLQRRGEIGLNFMEGRRRQPTWVRPALAFAMAALLGVSGITGYLVRTEAQSRQGERERLNRERRAAAVIAATREARQREANHLRAFAGRIGKAEDPGVPAVFAQYLCATVPMPIRLTEVSMHKSTNGWTLHLEGVTREQGSRYLAVVEEFEAELVEGVFKVAVVDSTHRRAHEGVPPEGTPSGGNSLKPDGARGSERSFFLTGLIQ